MTTPVSIKSRLGPILGRCRLMWLCTLIGGGESDFTWSAWGGGGYKFDSFDLNFGWRYKSYDVGSDTTISEIDISGPFAGVMFRW